MLRFEGLDKSYGERKIFHNISYSLNCGVYALQGSNGIGKSTLLKLLSGAEALDAGEVWINGTSLVRSPLAAKQHLSYVPDNCPIYPFMTGRAFLNFIAMAKKVELGPDILDLVHNFGLNVYLDTRVDTMSLGTQKKFLLSAAWIGDPQVLLLDEPSNGLDAKARELLVHLFQERQHRSTVLFSAHDADFVAATEATVLTMDHILTKTA